MFCEPVALVQLEPMHSDGSAALSWEESHSVVSRAWRRVLATGGHIIFIPLFASYGGSRMELTAPR